jgi:hypothetical protein
MKAFKIEDLVEPLIAGEYFVPLDTGYTPARLAQGARFKGRDGKVYDFFVSSDALKAEPGEELPRGQTLRIQYTPQSGAVGDPEWLKLTSTQLMLQITKDKITPVQSPRFGFGHSEDLPAFLREVQTYLVSKELEYRI